MDKPFGHDTTNIIWLSYMILQSMRYVIISHDDYNMECPID